LAYEGKQQIYGGGSHFVVHSPVWWGKESNLGFYRGKHGRESGHYQADASFAQGGGAGEGCGRNWRCGNCRASVVFHAF